MTSHNHRPKRWKRRLLDAVAIGIIFGILIEVLWIVTEFRMLNPL